MATILAVDDSNSMRQILKTTLESAGHHVVEASDGDEGLQKARSTRFDMVFTDQTMPNLCGVDLVRALRTLDAYQHTPILILTTESDEGTKQAGRAAGATGWLLKPFDPVRLLATVQTVLDRTQRGAPVAQAQR